MHLGIKIGPGNGHTPSEWQLKLDNDLNIRHTEVYFDLERWNEYPSMFAWLQQHGIQSRLHASSLLPDGIVPTLATSHQQVRQASADLLRRTLDTAANVGAEAVVFHPGSYRVQQRVNGRNTMWADDTLPAWGNALLHQEMADLSNYADRCGAILLAENLPLRDLVCRSPECAETIEPGFVSRSVLRELARSGISLCLDVGHLVAEIMADGHAETGWAQVLQATAELSPYARHLHLSTVRPPFNGIDSHNGFLDEDAMCRARPTHAELLTWLRLFPQPGLWLIPEPDGDAYVHLENHRALRTLIGEQIA